MGERVLTSLGDILPDDGRSKLLFRDEQKDDFAVAGAIIRYSSFIRLGLKQACFSGCSITQSIFDDVYARNAKFVNVDFTGSVFRNCNFEKAQFQSCNFRYVRFINCLLPVHDIIANLPSESNLRQVSARNLKVNFNALGEKKAADQFLKIEIQAEQKELLQIARSKESYYRREYDTLDRLQALGSYMISRSSGFIWGYGRRYENLILSYSIFTLLLALILFIFSGTFIEEGDSREIVLSFQQTFLTVFREGIGSNGTLVANSSLSILILILSRVLSIVYIGLLAATLYRRISR